MQNLYSFTYIRNNVNKATIFYSSTFYNDKDDNISSQQDTRCFKVNVRFLDNYHQ